MGMLKLRPRSRAARSTPVWPPEMIFRMGSFRFGIIMNMGSLLVERDTSLLFTRVETDKDLRENNLDTIAPRFGSDLNGTIEKHPRHSTAMLRVFRLRPVQPRNGSWAQKRRVRNWCAWCNTKSRGHLGGDETFLYCARCAKSLRGLL